MKKEKVLANILFIFGFVLLAFSLTALVYQIIHVCTDNLMEYYENTKLLKIYLVIEFSTIIFRLVLSMYAIYGRKHIDDVINPLFTFTIMFLIFVIIEAINFFGYGGFDVFPTAASINVMIDIVVVFFFSVVILLFKIDDWWLIKEADL